MSASTVAAVGEATGSVHRARTITWKDPVPAARAGLRMSGLEYLQAIAAGELPPPPMARLMDFELPRFEPGRATFRVTPQEFHYNPIGVVHGGLAATMLDSAMGCAVQTTLPAGTGYTTLELSVSFVRPITVATGRVRAEGEVIHGGSRVATAEGRVLAEDSGKLLAHAKTTCLILSPDHDR